MVSVNKCWVVACAFNDQRLRLAILAGCLMLMNARSSSVCAVRTPNYGGTLRF